MCLTCGCSEPDRRQRPTDITATDIARAAAGSHTLVADIVRNLRVSCERLEAKEAGLPTRTAPQEPAGRRS